MKSNQVGPKGPQEVESPVLELGSWIDTWDSVEGGVNWICCAGLSKLFDLADADRIRLVAKRRASSTTYKVELDVLGGMIKPLDVNFLYDELYSWLQKQVKAGRPNIGVYIIENR